LLNFFWRCKKKEEECGLVKKKRKKKANPTFEPTRGGGGVKWLLTAIDEEVWEASQKPALKRGVVGSESEDYGVKTIISRIPVLSRRQN